MKINNNIKTLLISFAMMVLGLLGYNEMQLRPMAAQLEEVVDYSMTDSKTPPSDVPELEEPVVDDPDGEFTPKLFPWRVWYVISQGGTPNTMLWFDIVSSARKPAIEKIPELVKVPEGYKFESVYIIEAEK